MNYAELLCAVKRIANILNNRPISVQRTKTDAQDEDFLHPLTPNMLLLMGNSGYVSLSSKKLREPGGINTKSNTFKV